MVEILSCTKFAFMVVHKYAMILLVDIVKDLVYLLTKCA